MGKELKDRIQELEATSKILDPDAKERKEFSDEVFTYGSNFLDRLDEEKSYTQEGYDDEALSKTDFEQPVPVADVLDLLKDHMEKPGINTASGGHLGYIPGGGLYAAAMGDHIAAVTNKYAGVFYASPGAVRIENALIEWTGKLAGYEKGFGGNLTSGGSIANFTGIVTAREAKSIKGADYHRTVIYSTILSHHSIKKAITIAGLRECILRNVPLDSTHKMDTAVLEQQIVDDKKSGLQPFLVVGNAGSTNIGSIDPLKEIGSIAREHDLWFHVDGAYGGYFILLDECKKKMEGLELADSIVMDPHKGLFLPYGLGIVLVKEVAYMRKAFAYEASYMQDTVDFGKDMSPADVSPELSKHFRGMRMWLPLKLYGVQAFRDCLEEKLLLTRYFAEKVQELGFEMMCAPELSVAAFRHVPKNGDVNEFNKKLVEAMHNEGEIFISSTMLDGKYILRFACLSFRTHLDHVDRLLAMLKKHKEALL